MEPAKVWGRSGLMRGRRHCASPPRHLRRTPYALVTGSCHRRMSCPLWRSPGPARPDRSRPPGPGAARTVAARPRRPGCNSARCTGRYTTASQVRHEYVRCPAAAAGDAGARARVPADQDLVRAPRVPAGTLLGGDLDELAERPAPPSRSPLAVGAGVAGAGRGGRVGRARAPRARSGWHRGCSLGGAARVPPWAGGTRGGSFGAGAAGEREPVALQGGTGHRHWPPAVARGQPTARGLTASQAVVHHRRALRGAPGSVSYR